jgi:hypothetical protein
VERTVRELAEMTGESPAEAVRIAAEARLRHLRHLPRTRRKPTVEEVLALVRSFNLQKINEDLTEDEILGYGPDGLPQ